MPDPPAPDRSAAERRSVAAAAVRDLILSGEAFRAAVATAMGTGVRETEAISYLRVRGSLSQLDLARELHLSPASVTALVDRLERQGLAQRSTSPADRRVTLVGLTDQAVDAAARIWDVLLEVVATTPGCDTDQTVDVLHALAAQLRILAPDR
ncbi:MarR family winged helix-turn-helix transcriptional regulator [uncultured Jatrophihabitans sp.]|uniref:MarR family winged helix-turn-helix transcriptional regulator n=1 Tax=uncultured Jatrophihabitans sp. TaxID=1610747 RepID=UPI0035CB1B5C